MFIPPAEQCRTAVQGAQCTSKNMHGQSDMDHADCEHSLVEDPSSSQLSPSVTQDVDLQSIQAKANPTCQPIPHASFSCTREQEFERGPATEDGETHTSVHDVSHGQHSVDIIESSHPSFRLSPPVLQEGDLQSSLNTGPIAALLHMRQKLPLSLEGKPATECERTCSGTRDIPQVECCVVEGCPSPFEHSSLMQNADLQTSPNMQPHTDWSRTTRQHLALLKAGSDSNQAKITSFFEVVDKISSIIDNSPEISGVFQVVQNQRIERKIDNFCPLLRQLLSNAEKNVLKLPQQRRHELLLKKFATSLFIYSGPLAYNFLHRNLPEALPSLRTVQRVVSHEYRPLHEGEFKFDELLSHLSSYNAPKVITIGEDATRLISRVEYDIETNKLVGFVLPCDDRGLPRGDAFVAVSFESIEESFHVADVAKYAFVYMAQSLSEGVPAFCLACMGTNNKFTAHRVLKRWKYIYSECKKRGIMVVSFGADGDSRELKAMQVSSLLFPNTDIITFTFFQPAKAFHPIRVALLVCSEEANCHSLCTRCSACSCEAEVQAY